MNKITKNDLLIDYTLKNFTNGIEDKELVSEELTTDCYSRLIKMQTQSNFLSNIIPSVEVISKRATSLINETFKEFEEAGYTITKANVDIGTFKQLGIKPVYYNIYQMPAFKADAGDAQTLEEVDSLLDNDELNFVKTDTGIYIFEFLICYKKGVKKDKPKPKQLFAENIKRAKKLTNKKV